MIQDQIDEEETIWAKDRQDDDSEVIKLAVGESIEGELIDKYQSVKYDAGIYKIQKKDDDKPKVIVGTTILDKMLVTREIGEKIKIERLEDQTSGTGREYQMYEVYHEEKEKEKKWLDDSPK